MSKNVQITVGDKTVTATKASVTADGASYEVYIVGKNSKGKNNVENGSKQVVNSVVKPNSVVSTPSETPENPIEAQSQEMANIQALRQQPTTNLIKPESIVNTVEEESKPSEPAAVVANTSSTEPVANVPKTGGKRRRTIRRAAHRKRKTLKRISRRK